jgi:phage tail-like protein
MAERLTPYGAFNFIVKIAGDQFGGFSDVSGLETELQISEYRLGNERTQYVTKIPGMVNTSDITLKRGLVNSKDMWDWIKEARSLSGERGIAAKRDVVITLMDETGEAVQSWLARGALPLKYTGPTLAAKGGGDVAMEELVLASDFLELMDSPSP